MNSLRNHELRTTDRTKQPDTLVGASPQSVLLSGNYRCEWRNCAIPYWLLCWLWNWTCDVRPLSQHLIRQLTIHPRSAIVATLLTKNWHRAYSKRNSQILSLQPSGQCNGNHNAKNTSVPDFVGIISMELQKKRTWTDKIQAALTHVVSKYRYCSWLFLIFGSPKHAHYHFWRY